MQTDIYYVLELYFLICSLILLSNNLVLPNTDGGERNKAGAEEPSLILQEPTDVSNSGETRAEVASHSSTPHGSESVLSTEVEHSMAPSNNLKQSFGDRDTASSSTLPEMQLTKHSVDESGQLKASSSLLNTSLATSQNGPLSHTSTRAVVGDADPITILGKVPEQRLVPSSSDIFVSVKTSNATEDNRLPPMLLTWMQTIHPKQVCL